MNSSHFVLGDMAEVTGSEAAGPVSPQASWVKHLPVAASLAACVLTPYISIPLALCVHLLELVKESKRHQVCGSDSVLFVV